MIARIAGCLRRCLEIVLITGVRGYQIFIGPLLPRACRFYPSCSQYFILAVRKHGPIRGALMGAWRIVRCNPWCQGGFDPP
jgi:putative membrane protein insertion efficiency factor